MIVLGVVLEASPKPSEEGSLRPGSTGTIIGTVMEISDEFLRVQAPGDSAHRYWFKWVDTRNAKPDKDIQAAASRIKVGDKVEVKWSLDDRRRIESLKPAVTATAETPKEEPRKESPGKEEPAGAGTAPAEPASQSMQTAAPGETTGEVVNAFLDNLLAFGDRVLELPLFMLLAIVAVVGAGTALVMHRLCGKGRRPRLYRVMLAVVAALLAFAAACIVDRKIVRLQSEVRELRSRMSTDAIALLNAIPKQDTKRRSFLFDPNEVQDILRAQFGEVSMLPLIYDEATDVVQVRRKDPIAQACLAVVDLRHPALEIKLGATIRKKRLTSQFARENNCTVAINGEAGRSSGSDSGLGEWTGNLIDRGQVILLEDTSARPFLSFDRGNRATYSPAAVVDRTVTPERYNVIWGRYDALLEGEVPTGDSRSREPRTVMAINKDGTRLYLLVVDGRQPNYSMGFTRADVGKFLKAFGAYNGMLCDEGGSSCIYLRKLGGISNIPSEGRERPTYTHFGITLRGSE